GSADPGCCTSPGCRWLRGRNTIPEPRREDESPADARRFQRRIGPQTTRAGRVEAGDRGPREKMSSLRGITGDSPLNFPKNLETLHRDQQNLRSLQNPCWQATNLRGYLARCSELRETCVRVP